MAAAVLRIVDCTASGEVVNRVELRLASERIKVREVIERRVREEVARYNEAQPGYFKGLVQPTDAEVTLNGFKVRQRRKIDADEQCRKAIEAFDANGFFLLVDDRQLTDLDQEIGVTDDTTVQFLKLVPLVGG
jgi:hypothetical protein